MYISLWVIVICPPSILQSAPDVSMNVNIFASIYVESEPITPFRRWIVANAIFQRPVLPAAYKSIFNYIRSYICYELLHHFRDYYEILILSACSIT